MLENILIGERGSRASRWIRPWLNVNIRRLLASTAKISSVFQMLLLPNFKNLASLSSIQVKPIILNWSETKTARKKKQ